MGDFLGGGLVFAVAAALWIMYLIPTWKRRRHFDATEMNAVRMQQTIRALAETADVPEEVEVEASARAVIEQKRILREAEAAALAEVREATAKSVGFDMKAYHAKRRARIARMISAVVLLVTLVGTVVSGVMPPMRSVWAGAGLGLAGTAALAEELALVVLALLARVEAGHGAVVTHHAGPHLAGLAFGVGQLHGGGQGGVLGGGNVGHGKTPWWVVGNQVASKTIAASA